MTKIMTSFYRLAHQYNGCRKVTSAIFPQVTRMLTVKPVSKTHTEFGFPEDSSPQGIQGSEGCPTFKLWLESCQRYGLANCDQQLQGIQTGRKTIAQVMAEQEALIAQIAEQYRNSVIKPDMQGIQNDVSSLPDINMPCPQGIQGENCERFKLWLGNCHRFGFTDCMQQLESFQQGRKTLMEIFEEQDKAIKEVTRAGLQLQQQYSTSSHPQQEVEINKNDNQEKLSVEDEAALTYGQKLRRAVKEYGSTVMVFHIGISLMSLGFFYTLVNSGIDVVGILSRFGMSGDSIQAKIAGGTGTFVVAYAVHKVFAPARIAVTLTATPLIVRYLRRIGFLKTPKKHKS